MKKFLLFMFFAVLSTQALAADVPAVGTDAPSFNLQDQNGEWHTLEN